jgi:hypothetical protein
VFNLVAMFASLSATPAYPKAPDTPMPSVLETYYSRTSVEPRCKQAAGDEIIVCGRREADRYRVPLIERDAGDPRGETLMGERERIQNRTTPCQQRGPYLVGCGMVGVTVSTTIGRDGIRYRPLAK